MVTRTYLYCNAKVCVLTYDITVNRQPDDRSWYHYASNARADLTPPLCHRHDLILLPSHHGTSVCRVTLLSNRRSSQDFGGGGGGEMTVSRSVCGDGSRGEGQGPYDELLFSSLHPLTPPTIRHFAGPFFAIRPSPIGFYTSPHPPHRFPPCRLVRG